MKTKIFLCLALVGLTACVVLNWYINSLIPPKVPPIKAADVRRTLEECSSEKELQAEADSLFIQYGDKSWISLIDSDLSMAPGLAKFGNTLSRYPLWEIVPSGTNEIGVPSHVLIRFGDHFHYQYILIFRTGSDLSSIKSPFEQVTKNIYFRP